MSDSEHFSQNKSDNLPLLVVTLQAIGLCPGKAQPIMFIPTMKHKAKSSTSAQGPLVCLEHFA